MAAGAAAGVSAAFASPVGRSRDVEISSITCLDSAFPFLSMCALMSPKRVLRQTTKVS